MCLSHEPNAFAVYFQRAVLVVFVLQLCGGKRISARITVTFLVNLFSEFQESSWLELSKLNFKLSSQLISNKKAVQVFAQQFFPLNDICVFRKSRCCG